MRGRVAFVVALLIGVVLGLYGGAQQAGSVSISVMFPPDGYITVSSEVEVQGKVSVERAGIELFMVIVSVNGETQKVTLQSDGTFQTKAALELGTNLISAIAITDGKELASTKVYVTRQNPILFFDDFEGRAPRSEWAATSGTWVISDGIFTITQYSWQADAFAYVATPDSGSWQDYAVEVDVLNAHTAWNAGIVVRAQDDLNKILFKFQSDEWICWGVIKNGKWSGCIGQVTPGLTGNVRLRVEVRSDTYTAYVNGVKRTSMQDSTFSRGMPGLYIYMKHQIAFDNFKVESLEPGAPQPIGILPPLPETPPATEPPVVSPPTATSADLQTIKERLDRLEPTVATLQAQVGENRTRLGSLENRVTGFEQSLASLKTTVGSLAEERKNFTTQLQAVTGRVDALEKKSGLPTDIDRRLSTVEQEISQVKDQVKGLARLGLLAGGGAAALALLVALLCCKQ